MIHYLTGNAIAGAVQAASALDGSAVLVHVCNNRGGWGAGFTGAISRQWIEPEQAYRRMWRNGWCRLGVAQLVTIPRTVGVVIVANLVAQDGYKSKTNPAPCNLDALGVALRGMDRKLAGTGKRSYHMPRIGCGLGGRTWGEISPLVDQLDGEIFVYDRV